MWKVGSKPKKTKTQTASKAIYWGSYLDIYCYINSRPISAGKKLKRVSYCNYGALVKAYSKNLYVDDKGYASRDLVSRSLQQTILEAQCFLKGNGFPFLGTFIATHSGPPGMQDVTFPAYHTRINGKKERHKRANISRLHHCIARHQNS